MRLSRDQMDRDAVAIIARLQREGYLGYLVGGCVRDALLGIAPKDFDIATTATPEELRDVFGRRCRLIGRRFKLAHVRSGPKIFEVATFRGRPESQVADEEGFVVRANTWGSPVEDALSRDFTMNGLFFDPVSEELHDHVGGLEDIAVRRVRTIGDAEQRFREDPVRILRAVKFSGRLGLELDPAIASVAGELSPLIHDCPIARVTEEIFRLLESGHARATMEVAREVGVLEPVLPELAAAVTADEERWAEWLTWLGALDRQVRAHGLLPRESTFVLTVWPVIEAAILEAEAEADEGRGIDWGGLSAELIEEASLRMTVPIRHRQHLRGTANVLRRLTGTARHRRRATLVRSPTLPTALTILRISFTLGRGGLEARARGSSEALDLATIYEHWASTCHRHGITTAPFEARFEDAAGARGGGRSRRSRGGNGRAEASPPSTPAADGEEAPRKKRRRRRRRRGGPRPESAQGESSS